MKYLRSFSTLGCPDYTLDEVLRLAADHGIVGVELRCLGGTTDLPAWLAKTYGSPAALAARLREGTVRVLALDTSLKLAQMTSAEQEAFLQFVPWAEALNIPRLRVFDGGVAGDPAAPQEVAAGWRWWDELRLKHGWQTDLMIETHDSLVNTPALLALIREAPGCGMLWDSHHTWKKGGENPLVTWAAIKSQVVHVHVKDSISRPSARHAFTYVLPGEGEFPMPPLQSVLAKEFTGPVSLEWELLWHPYLRPIEAALKSAAGGWW